MRYPHFSIFLLWIGRISKPIAWEEYFMILSDYLAQYYSRELYGKPVERWERFNSIYQNERLNSYVADKLKICEDNRILKRFTDLFNKWTVVFGLA